MRIKTLVIGYALALTLFLFAQRRSETAQPSDFSGVVDLTHGVQGSALPAADRVGRLRTAALLTKDSPHRVLASSSGTTIDAPAHLARGMWTVDQIPPERLVAPLAVLDVTQQVKRNPDYQVSVEDIARWEQIHGE